MFSQRTSWNRQPTLLSLASEARRAAGMRVVDLTASNPTRCAFTYPGEELLAPLTDPRGLVYDPEPFGLLAAREAVCAYYRDQDASAATILPQQVCLATTTSEAYSFLFRLLCDPGDEILIAQPSYPLFNFLADLDDVSLVSYPLFYDHGWQIEPGAIEARISARTRAIALVHPNNPTGHYTSHADRAYLEQLCRTHQLALIVDEVFLDYPIAPPPGPSFACGPHPALTFVLSGLSKIAALPQMKASWIVTAGPPQLAAEAAARLELIADTFLSINAPVQHALPTWLAGRHLLQAQIAARTRTNLAALDALLHGSPLTRLRLEAGWYACLRLPALGSDDDLALSLLQEHGVLVHPGHYYGFPSDGWLVVSLLPPPSDFEEAIRALLAGCAARLY